MAIQTIDRTKKTPAVKPTVVGVSDYQGTAMLSVGPEDAHFKALLQASVAKWARLLTLDGDGDSAILAIVSHLLENAIPDADAPAAVDAMDQLVLWWLASRGSMGEAILAKSKEGLSIEDEALKAMAENAREGTPTENETANA